jgi:malate permease and related proteins
MDIPWLGAGSIDTRRMVAGISPSGLAQIFTDALLPPIVYCTVGALADRYLEFESRTLSRLTVYVFLPPLMFSALMHVNVAAGEVMRVAAFILLTLTGMSLAGVGYARLLGMDAATTSSATMASTFFNGVNLGFPVALYSFGEPGLLAAGVIVAVNGIPHNVCGLLFAARGALSTREALRALFRMPFPYVMGLALTLRLGGTVVPEPLMEPISEMGRASIPLVLVCVGMELRRIKVTSVNREVVGTVGLRLLFAPVLAWFVSDLVGLTGMLRTAAVLQASMPTAVMPIVYARLFGGNVEYISKAVFLSTLASVLTIPVVIALLK